MDFILNGTAHGNVAQVLADNDFDPGCLRPWRDKYKGRDCSFISVTNEQGELITRPAMNATTLRKEEWKILDDAVHMAARQRLRFVADLRSGGLTFTVPNGMGRTVLESERMSDPGEAEISMDGLRKSNADRPEFDLVSLPLPIIHSDFHFSARQLRTGRNVGTPIDTSMAEAAARRVAETAEQLALGTWGTFVFGGATLYGATNSPNRLTQTITAPTDSSWTQDTLLTEILSARQLSQNSRHYGPWMLYTSLAWDEYLDRDYSSSKGDNTLRQRIAAIEGITGIRTLDFLPSATFDMLLVQMTTDVIREVIGMDVTALQWESQGGLQVNYKVMAILVPQIRADYYSRTGIVHCGTGV